MQFITKFFQTLFSGVDPERVALWVRGLFIGIVGALSQGAIDLLTQILGLLNSGDAVIPNISWQLIARTIAIAVIPAIILYLKRPDSASKE